MQPELSVLEINEENMVGLLFNEPVNLETAETIAKENLLVEITGPLDFYQFSYRIIPQGGELVPG